LMYWSDDKEHHSERTL